MQEWGKLLSSQWRAFQVSVFALQELLSANIPIKIYWLGNSVSIVIPRWLKRNIFFPHQIYSSKSEYCDKSRKIEYYQFCLAVARNIFFFMHILVASVGVDLLENSVGKKMLCEEAL